MDDIKRWTMFLLSYLQYIKVLGIFYVYIIILQNTVFNPQSYFL